MTESELQTAIAREDLCRYLAACYYEPDADLVKVGMFDALAEAAGRVDLDLAPGAHRLGEYFRSADPNELLLDYTRLFLGPMDILAKPYGSYWLDEEKTLMGDSTQAVLDLYCEADFEMDEEFKELPDHIAAELEFLYLLTFQENEARIRSQGDAAKWGELRQRFLMRHLGAWIEPFAAAIRVGARCGFYRELAAVTETFVLREKGRGRT